MIGILLKKLHFIIIDQYLSEDLSYLTYSYYLF